MRPNVTLLPKLTAFIAYASQSRGMAAGRYRFGNVHVQGRGKQTEVFYPHQASEERLKLSWTPAFHTLLGEDPAVFHDNTECPAAREIALEQRRPGVGTRRSRCYLCAALNTKPR